MPRFLGGAAVYRCVSGTQTDRLQPPRFDMPFQDLEAEPCSDCHPRLRKRRPSFRIRAWLQPRRPPVPVFETRPPGATAMFCRTADPCSDCHPRLRKRRPSFRIRAWLPCQTSPPPTPISVFATRPPGATPCFGEPCSHGRPRLRNAEPCRRRRPRLRNADPCRRRRPHLRKRRPSFRIRAWLSATPTPVPCRRCHPRLRKRPPSFRIRAWLQPRRPPQPYSKRAHRAQLPCFAARRFVSGRGFSHAAPPYPYSRRAHRAQLPMFCRTAGKSAIR